MNKNWILFAGLILAAFTAFYFYQAYNIAPGIDFKKISLVDLDNKQVNLEVHKGKKTIICFGASWCGSCLQELKAITEIKEEKLNDVEIIVISDEPLEKVQAFKNRRGFPFVFYKLNGTFKSLGIISIPTTYILDKNLKVKKQTVGYIDWRDASTIEHLKKIMD